MLHTLDRTQREALLEKVLSFFLYWCRKEFNTILYPYQIRLARALLSSILVEPKTVFVKICRQAGKTELLTLLLRFLILHYIHLTGRPLMAAIASPHGEQAKTDVDRIKKSLQQLRERWKLEDRENNQSTIRAYRNNRLYSEMFKFSLAPTTHNESKTLNILAIEESHKADHSKRSDELDPMLASTGGVTWHFGVGCTTLNDYKRGCDGEFPDSVVVKVDVEQVIKDRREVFEQTGDPIHLAYERAFQAELRTKGRNNPEIRRNYYLEDMIEEGNFISRERLLSMSRPKPVCSEHFYVGIDWARTADHTWVAVVNENCQLVTMFKYPHVPYEEQIRMMLDDLEPYRHHIVAVRGDSTGEGDMPMEYLINHGTIPMGDASMVKFTSQSKNEMFTNFEAALFREPDDPLRFSYPSNHPLTGEFEEQMIKLLREYKGAEEYLSPHAPNEPGAHDDAPVCVALALLAAKGMRVESILFA